MVIDDIPKVMEAILIGMRVALFLFNTRRVVQAITLCKECLTLVNYKSLEKDDELVTLLYIALYTRVFYGYDLISDYSSAIECGRKLLILLHKYGKRDKERTVTLKLAELYHRRGKYIEAKQLYEKALTIMIETGKRKGEGACYVNLGAVFQSLGEYARAEEYLKKALLITKKIGDKTGEASSYGNLGTVFLSVGEYVKAKEYLQKALLIRKEIGDIYGEAIDYQNLGTVFFSVGEYVKAGEYFQKALALSKEIGDKQGEGRNYGFLGNVFRKIGDYVKAEEYILKALAVKKEIGDKKGEATEYGNLGYMFLSVSEFAKAEEHLQKKLTITKEIGDKTGEAVGYGNLGSVYKGLGDYVKAEEYHQNALTIMKEIGDKKGEAKSNGNLGTVCLSVGDFAKAEEYHQKALAVWKEIGDKEGEATNYGNLGTVFLSVGEYVKGEEYLQRALAIRKEIGGIREEATAYGNLGHLFRCRGDYAKAKEYLQKALAINKEIGHKEGEASDYGNLGTVFFGVGEYVKAEEYFWKALAIRKKIGDKEGQARDYGNLGNLFRSLGDYAKAEEYHQNALTIMKEIGDKKGEATTNGNLGTVFSSVGDYAKAEEYVQRALAIRREIGDKEEEATDLGNLGVLLCKQGEHAEIRAKEYLQKALVLKKEIGDKRGEATLCLNLGSTFHSPGGHIKAEEYFQKALAITKEIGDQRGEASSYGKLGNLFQSLGDYARAKEYHEKALAISNDIGYIELQFQSHFDLTWAILMLGGNINEAVSNLFLSIQRCEKMHSFLKDNDQFKISFLDEHVSPYRLLSTLFCWTGKPQEALCVVELGRARALADIMSAQYSVDKEISVNPQSWDGIEKIMKKERNCTCLYISYDDKTLFLWILMPNKTITLREHECMRSVGDIFGNKAFRNGRVLSPKQCEDRSLFSLINACQVTLESSPWEDIGATFRLIEEDEDEIQHAEPPTFAQCYNMIIAPVVDLLQKPEIVIVPDRFLYQVPFAALTDESDKYLSDTFRIRIVPSLTTLKLIQDSPADYHSQTGALIVGAPNVCDVYYKGYLEKLPPLPWARKEAEMIGRLLPGSQLLLGEHATKQAVVQCLHSVSLIHFAAHGDAERGEIALSPSLPTDGIPHEEDYLLTMAEISAVRLTAKLVVLSCCHSARGQIKSEGVVGIARAFLGSGARSVLVALWAIQDEATEQFMSRFYEHLVQGESASECIHQAMKWMRGNGFSDVSQWAPFMLIGDNVTFDFGK